MSATSQPVVLRAGGTMVVLDVAGPGLPRVLHGGAALGALDGDGARALAEAGRPALPLAATNDAVQLTLLPTQAQGWPGRPGLSGHRDGNWPFLRLELTEPV